MNLFVTSKNTYECALWLDDKRRVAQIQEIALLLSTTIRQLYPKFEFCDRIYRPTHLNHPVTRWVLHSWGNYQWALNFLNDLIHQHGKCKTTRNYCKQISLFPYFYSFLLHAEKNKIFFETDFTDFVNCARNSEKGIDFTNVTPVTEAYRQYLKARWATDKKPPTWNRGEKPYWAD